MIRTKHLFLPSLALALAGGAFAQGDDCSTAATLSGVGTFSYDTTGFTTSGFDGGGTCGSYNLNFDGFFQWSAPANGDFNIDTFGTAYDTTLQVHAGVACAATCVDFNDDTGGLQSEVSIVGATAGDMFLIQVAGYSATTGFGPGTLNITQYIDPCAGFVDDAFEDNDDCASATPVTDGTYPGLQIDVADEKDIFSTCVADGATITVDILFTDALVDLDLFLRDAASAECGTGYGANMLAYGFSVTDNETATWTNTLGMDLNITIEVDVYAAGTQNCNSYDLVISGSGGCGGGVGTTFCDPMDNNSTGFPTVLSGSFGTGVGSDLHLEATQGPPTNFGYFLVGTGPSDPGIVISQGRLCLDVTGGNVFGRYNVAGGSLNSVGIFDAGGVLQNAVGTSLVGSGFDVPSTVPITGSPTIMAGDTWYFQLWHREAAGASNFSNGLAVSF
ncbi:MAG: hypothetical protein H6830_11620 [Planctomycetes bacterium]|nr:hypothetical protein [Planctomycetota bacterium]MCB9908824.1 hypothetical protein [Planctomycetota bacterium]MCB9912351.1 hypothetical protein [Planctomycetota bacterium]